MTGDIYDYVLLEASLAFSVKSIFLWKLLKIKMWSKNGEMGLQHWKPEISAQIREL